MTGSAWEHLATFLAVAESGSLSAAAQRLGVSQPTAGRHVQALEDELGVTLFVRHARGLALTDEGATLLASARGIAERMDAIFRGAQGAEAKLRGSVRISAAEPVGVYAMGPCFAQMRSELPDISLELVIDNSPANLSSREADIAARMFKPTQLDLIARRIGMVELGLFASREYLASHGMPKAIQFGSGHTWIGMDRDPSWHRFIAEIGLSARDFAYRCDNILAQIQAVRDGVGIGGMHVALASQDDRLVRVLPEISLPPLEMWLVMHRDLRGNAAVRTVFERLVVGLSAYLQPTKKPASTVRGRSSKDRPRTQRRSKDSG